MKAGNRRSLIVGGLEFWMNPHGVIGLRREDGSWDAFYTWPEHGVVSSEDEGRALRREVEQRFFDARLFATCSGEFKTCHCPPRF